MRLLKRIFTTLFKIGLIGFITLLCFEICYRYNIIDFYKSEILALNSKKDLEKKNADVLVFGDSFSATSKAINYVDRLRDAFKTNAFINLSIPGTGIKQVNTFAKEKIAKYQPEIIIYQIYVGNDLLDVENFTNYKKTISPLKYAYWQASNNFLSLSYLNHKANAFKPKKNYRHKTLQIDSFATTFYNKRSKGFLKINPLYLEETVNMSGRFATKYTKWLKEIESLLEDIPKTTQVYFVWIPHCTQVNSFYKNNFIYLGAKFTDASNYLKEDYLFYSTAKKDLNAYSNVKLINMLPVFKQADSVNNRVYFYNDPHLNKYGNDVLANYLQKIIY